MKNKSILLLSLSLLLSSALHALPRIVVLGESHARFGFSNYDQLHYYFPYNETTGATFSIYEIFGKTMYSIGRNGLNIGSYGVNDHEIVLFVFGEIDVRAHIVKQRDEKGRDLEEILTSLVTNYINVINANRRNYPHITCVVMEIMPPTNQCFNPNIPFFGELSDRAAIAKKLNSKLKDACAQNNILFLPTHEIYAAPDGTLIPELSDGCVHTQHRYNYLLKNRLIQLLLANNMRFNSLVENTEEDITNEK